MRVWAPYLVGAGLVDRDMVVYFCGVNMGACVYETTLGLARRLYKEAGIASCCRIVMDLCGDENSRFRFIKSIKARRR